MQPQPQPEPNQTPVTPNVEVPYPQTVVTPNVQAPSPPQTTVTPVFEAPYPQTPVTPNVEAPYNRAPTPDPLFISSQPVVNKIWSSSIKRVNYIFLAICLGFLVIVDLPILVTNTKLAQFFYAMLIAFGLFVGCLVFELWAGKRLQNSPQNSLDSIVFLLANMRNIAVVLNVIPLIQIIGFLVTPLALMFILINAILITIRLKQRPATAS